MTTAMVTGMAGVDRPERFAQPGPMNPGHEDFACSSCHREAPGSFRQQAQAELRYLLGTRGRAPDFGMEKVDNRACTTCHDRPEDRHPSFRFLEPRFKAARAAIAPETCISCHFEHSGRRVTRGGDFCSHCHQDLNLPRDPIEPTHRELAEKLVWDSCLRCHDFHGNHIGPTPRRLTDGHPIFTVESYLGAGPSPYSAQKKVPARSEVRH